jgi:hypothetical protein
MTEEKNFIDFIIAAKDSPNLYDGFLDKSDPQELYEFFNSNMYVVSIEDCEKLIKAKSDFGIEEGRIPPAY